MDALEKKAIDWFVQLACIAGGSGEEAEVMRFLEQEVLAMGGAGVSTEHTVSRSEDGEETTNLLAVVKPQAPVTNRVVFVAHMDTVPVCVAASPKLELEQDMIVSDNDQGLGSDDRAGCAVLLAVLSETLKKQPCSELAFLWTSREEVGQQGMRYMPTSVLERFDHAIILDGGTPNKITHGSYGKTIINLKASGVASHSANRSEDSQNAGMLLVDFLHKLQADAHVQKDDGKIEFFFNLYQLALESPANVIPEQAYAEVECRWANQDSIDYVRSLIEEFTRELAARGAGGVEASYEFLYPDYCVPKDAAVCKAVADAIRGADLQPVFSISNGGTDANWANKRGLSAVGIGCGQRKTHTESDYLVVSDFLAAIRIACGLIA